MNMTRREFLKDVFAALGFAAMPGGVLFAAPPGWRRGGTPNIVFGVVSDTHLRTRGGPTGKPGLNWPDKYFAAALECFKKQNVDAVVHCGDMAHRGQVEEMQFHANVWRRVFGEGGPVKLFVTGNHDRDGANYGDFVASKYPAPEERAKHVLATDMAANWERIWGEPYSDVWHKEVKGYHFFGRQWGVEDRELANLINSSAGACELDKGTKPFFFLTHSRPGAPLRKAVRRHRNAFSFFGHNHWSAASWNIMRIYYGFLPCIQCASCEPRGCAALVGDSYITKAKLHGVENAGRGRQCYVVRVYDDMLVIERHEVAEGGKLGADWVMPFERYEGEGTREKGEGTREKGEGTREKGEGTREKGRGKRVHPFSKGELKKVIGNPQFPGDAKLEVSLDKINKINKINKIEKTATDNPVNPVNPVQENSATPRLRVRIPLANGNPDSRVYAYEVVVVGDEGTPKLCKAIYAAGCNMGVGHEPNGGVTTLEIPKSELPPGKTLTFVVRPLTSLGTFGKPIATEFKV